MYFLKKSPTESNGMVCINCFLSFHFYCNGQYYKLSPPFCQNMGFIQKCSLVLFALGCRGNWADVREHTSSTAQFWASFKHLDNWTSHSTSNTSDLKNIYFLKFHKTFLCFNCTRFLVLSYTASNDQSNWNPILIYRYRSPSEHTEIKIWILVIKLNIILFIIQEVLISVIWLCSVFTEVAVIAQVRWLNTSKTCLLTFKPNFSPFLHVQMTWD